VCLPSQGQSVLLWPVVALGYGVPAVAMSVSVVVACYGLRLRCACRRKVSQCCCGLLWP